MHPGQQQDRRRALTLVELIVVISIIMLVAALAAAFVPRVQDRQNVSRGVDLLSQWLLIAKKRALHDNLVTGIRFIVDPNDPNAANNPNLFSMAVYVQQPLPITGGNPPSTSPPNGVVLNPSPTACQSVVSSGQTWTATFMNPQNPAQPPDFFNGQPTTPSNWAVQPGDYLDLRSSGVHFITAVASTQLTLATGTPFGPPTSTTTSPTYNYRILRMPRELIGEPVLQMPSTIAVDMNAGFSFNVPARTVPSGTFFEVLFAPDGSVVGPGVGGGKILLWVHDPTNADINLGGLVGVQTRTGFISSYDIGPAPNYYQFADAGRDEGL